MTLQEQLLTLLKELRDGVPQEHADAGICAYLDYMMYHRYNLHVHSREYYKYMRSWPYHSGENCYPVPDPEGFCSPGTKYQNTDNMWIDAYGELRMQLVNHMIEQLEKELRQVSL